MKISSLLLASCLLLVSGADSKSKSGKKSKVGGFENFIAVSLRVQVVTDLSCPASFLSTLRPDRVFSIAFPSCRPMNSTMPKVSAQLKLEQPV